MIKFFLKPWSCAGAFFCDNIVMNNNRKTIAISIPTGIGLEIGGYAGDFGYIARKFSKYFDVIINPNGVNGGILSAINQNMYYLEGYAFDEFLCGNLNLVRRQRPNKIGVIFDSAIPENVLNVHYNTVNAMKIVKGADIMEPLMTREPAGVEFYIDKETGISTGNIKNPSTLLEAGRNLIKKGADAIAVVCFFDDYDESDDKNYTSGFGVDPIGGVEAVISHLLVKELNLPCAHSPAFSSLEISDKIENPKVSSELISSTYLPCVIEGLQYAPQFSRDEGISYKDTEAFIVPYKSMGSKGVLGAYKNNIPIYTVKNNSQLNVCCENLGISAKMEFEDYYSCLEYLKEKCYEKI